MQPLLNTTKKIPFPGIAHFVKVKLLPVTWRTKSLRHQHLFGLYTILFYHCFYWYFSLYCVIQNFASADLSWIIPNRNSRKKQERPTSTSTSFFTLFTGAVLTIVLKHIHEYLLKKVIEKHSLRSWWYLRASTVVSTADTPIRTPRGFVFLLKGCPY